MAPTFDLAPGVDDDWRRLTPDQKQQFRTARDQMLADMVAGHGFRNGLRIKGVQGAAGVYEMTWADDGRATFSYGDQLKVGEPHIIWRRLGTHSIFKNP